jgi:hypothetical protein
MGGEPWALVGLKEVIGEAIGVGNVEIRLDPVARIVGVLDPEVIWLTIDVAVGRVVRTAIAAATADHVRWSSVYFAGIRVEVTGIHERLIGVVRIEVGGHLDGSEGNGVSTVSVPVEVAHVRDVRARGKSCVWVAEQIIDRAIFLDDDDDVLECGLGGRERRHEWSH